MPLSSYTLKSKSLIFSFIIHDISICVRSISLSFIYLVSVLKLPYKAYFQILWVQGLGCFIFIYSVMISSIYLFLVINIFENSSVYLS